MPPVANDGVPADWYPNPDDQGASQRYWDGKGWTEQTRAANRPRPAPQGAPQPTGTPFPSGPPQQQQSWAPQQQPKRKNWFARHKFLSAGLLLLIIIGIAIAANSGGGSSTSTTTSPGSTATSGTGGANKSSIDHLSDYKITSCGSDPSTGDFAAKVAITNTSSKSSNYFGTLAWVSTDGKTQYDTSPVIANNLAPGQTTSVDGFSLKTAQAGAVCKIVDSTRLAAN